MKTIKLDGNLIEIFFGEMDSDCLAQVQHLAQQGAVLNTITGELILKSVKTGIFTDYFTRELDDENKK